MKWTKEELSELRRLYDEYGNDWDKIKEELNTDRSRTSIRLQYQRYLSDKPTRKAKQGIPSINSINERQIHKFMANGDEYSEKLVEERALQTRESLLIAHGFDPKEFELVSGVDNKWQMPNTNQVKIDLYQSKITVKPKGKKLDQAEFKEELSKDLQPVTIKAKVVGKRNLVIGLADLHFPILKLSDTRYKLSEMIEIMEKGYKHIVIEQLGDLFHSSQMKSSQTLKGTLLEDVDMVKGIEDAKVFFDVILRAALECADKVSIEHACGNHSDFEYMFLMYLEVKYPQITVNYHNNYRTAYLLDNVGIMITHGDNAPKKHVQLFATEYKDIWCKATTQECHFGHRHTAEKDIDGVVLRQFATAKPNDEYEIRNGWTMNRKVIQLVEYDNDRAKVIYEV